MTREEAIKILESMSDISTQGEAIDMAIEALQAELTATNTEKSSNCGDLISRADAIEAVASADETNGTIKVFSGLEIIDMLNALPSADRPILKQTDTMIIADALRYLIKDEEWHLSDRTRADALREQFLNYGANMRNNK